MSNVERQLEVFEYGGTARSGKGTIVSWLAEMHPEVATDETGADYRSVTLGLMLTDVLETGMDGDTVLTTIKKVSPSELVGLAASRKEIEGENGKDALYTPEVNDMVYHVAAIPAVRKAVKKGFTKRVEAVRDNEEHSILLVDGRNLDQVIEPIEGTHLTLRTFVYCMPVEAARRECLRSGLVEGTDEWNVAFAKNYEAIKSRNSADASRPMDPVKPDEGAIEYWTSPDLMDSTIDMYAHFLFEDDRTAALQNIFTRTRDFTDIPRIGAGLKAVNQGRQIHFDTTPFASYDYPGSKHAMLLAANTMFEEAVRAQQILRSQA